MGSTISWDILSTGELRGQSSGSLPYETRTLVADETLLQGHFPGYWVSLGGAAYDGDRPRSANAFVGNQGEHAADG